MTLLAAAFLLAAAAVPAGASAGAPSGSLSRLPPDIAAEPVVRESETRLRDSEAMLAVQIRPPSKSLSLGLSTKLYQCWQLKLTSRRGLKVLEVLERLKSLHDALRNERAGMTSALLEYAASPKPDPALLKRIGARSQAIGGILAVYKTLTESGVRNGLIRVSEGGAFSGAASIGPLIRDDDYTMSYDDSLPQCPSAEAQK